MQGGRLWHLGDTPYMSCRGPKADQAGCRRRSGLKTRCRANATEEVRPPASSSCATRNAQGTANGTHDWVLDEAPTLLATAHSMTWAQAGPDAVRDIAVIDSPIVPTHRLAPSVAARHTLSPWRTHKHIPAHSGPAGWATVGTFCVPSPRQSTL